MDYKKLASDILKLVGGEKNVESVTNGMTRLRFTLKAVLPILKERLMDSWSHNKAIQKARESYRCLLYTSGKCGT